MLLWDLYPADWAFPCPYQAPPLWWRMSYCVSNLHCCFYHNSLFFPVSKHFSSKLCRLLLLCVIRTSCLAPFDSFEQTEKEQKHKGTSDEKRKHTRSESALKLNKSGMAFIGFINTRNIHVLFVDHDIFFQERCFKFSILCQGKFYASVMYNIWVLWH